MKLDQYPEQIETTQLEFNHLCRQLERLRDDYQEISDNLLLLILGATGEDGKLKYTNETARNLAFRRLTIADNLFLTLREKIQLAETAKSTISAKLERLRGQFSVAKLEKRMEIVKTENLAE